MSGRGGSCRFPGGIEISPGTVPPLAWRWSGPGPRPRRPSRRSRRGRCGAGTLPAGFAPTLGAGTRRRSSRRWQTTSAVSKPRRVQDRRCRNHITETDDASPHRAAARRLVRWRYGIEVDPRFRPAQPGLGNDSPGAARSRQSLDRNVCWEIHKALHHLAFESEALQHACLGRRPPSKDLEGHGGQRPQVLSRPGPLKEVDFDHEVRDTLSGRGF